MGPHYLFRTLVRIEYASGSFAPSAQLAMMPRSVGVAIEESKDADVGSARLALECIGEVINGSDNAATDSRYHREFDLIRQIIEIHYCLSPCPMVDKRNASCQDRKIWKANPRETSSWFVNQ